MSLELPADTAMLALVRDAVRHWLNFAEQPVGHWDVVATELFTNAVLASGHRRGPVLLNFELLDSLPSAPGTPGVYCQVSNEGSWLASQTFDSTPLDALVAHRGVDQLPHGRGLQIVTALTSGGTVRAESDRTVVDVWRES